MSTAEKKYTKAGITLGTFWPAEAWVPRFYWSWGSLASCNVFTLTRITETALDKPIRFFEGFLVKQRVHDVVPQHMMPTLSIRACVVYAFHGIFLVATFCGPKVLHTGWGQSCFSLHLATYQAQLST